jgi:hypothetical protein
MRTRAQVLQGMARAAVAAVGTTSTGADTIGVTEGSDLFRAILEPGASDVKPKDHGLVVRPKPVQPQPNGTGESSGVR